MLSYCRVWRPRSATYCLRILRGSVQEPLAISSKAAIGSKDGRARSRAQLAKTADKRKTPRRAPVFLIGTRAHDMRNLNHHASAAGDPAAGASSLEGRWCAPAHNTALPLAR